MNSRSLKRKIFVRQEFTKDLVLTRHLDTTLWINIDITVKKRIKIINYNISKDF